MIKHTQEPWKLDTGLIRDSNGKTIAVFGLDLEDILNSERAAMCVNALEGLSNDALNGGWNFTEMSKYTKQLEHEVNRLEHLLTEREEFILNGVEFGPVNWTTIKEIYKKAVEVCGIKDEVLVEMLKYFSGFGFWFDKRTSPPERETGKKILAYDVYIFEAVCDEDGDWCSIGGNDFTHWMPCPESPRLT